MPRGDAMAPPQLAADAPVVDILHPVEIGLLVHLGCELDVAVFDSGDGLDGERLDFDEPLRGQARLDDRLASVAVADVVGVVLHARQQALSFEVGDDALARDVAVESGVGSSILVDVSGIVHHVDGG